MRLFLLLFALVSVSADALAQEGAPPNVDIPTGRASAHEWMQPGLDTQAMDCKKLVELATLAQREVRLRKLTGPARQDADKRMNSAYPRYWGSPEDGVCIQDAREALLKYRELLGIH